MTLQKGLVIALYELTGYFWHNMGGLGLQEPTLWHSAKTNAKSCTLQDLPDKLSGHWQPLANSSPEKDLGDLPKHKPTAHTCSSVSWQHTALSTEAQPADWGMQSHHPTQHSRPQAEVPSLGCASTQQTPVYWSKFNERLPRWLQAGTSNLWGEAEDTGLFQPPEETALRWPNSSHSYLQGWCQENRARLFREVQGRRMKELKRPV